MSGATPPTADLVRGLLERKIIRFAFVGILNTVFGYALYLAGLFLGASPPLALAIATVIGALFNYFSTGRLVFRHSSVNRLPRFLFAYLAIYLLNIVMLAALTGAGISPAWAQAILLPAVAIASFLVFKLLVFPAQN